MKYTYKILTLAASAAAFVACDTIDADDRFIELDAIESERVVLLEEYTGQSCSNCPAAHEVVAELLSQYEGNLISVSIHGGPLAYVTSSRYTLLKTDEGDEYYYNNNVSAAPKGIVNRTSGELDKEMWSAYIRSALETASNIDIEVSATLSSDGSAIEIVTKLSPYDNIEGYLQLWVTEDSISAYQLGSGNTVYREYTHNHVFRSTVNGLNGEAVNLATREVYEYSHSIDVDTDWNTDNVSIVAFVYNSSDGVLQTTKTHVE